MSERSQSRPEDQLPAHVFELNAEAEELLAGVADGGHKQRTLYRCGKTTVAMFALGTGGGLPRHAVDGVVTVQVLRGRVSMDTPGRVLEFAVGGLLRMEPGLEHNVSAVEVSVILVHIARV